MPPKKNYKRKPRKVQKKKFVKKKINKVRAKQVEMLKLSEGSNDCQAITPNFHTALPVQLSGTTISIPKNSYYKMTSSKNTIGSTGPRLSSRIQGNDVYSKFLNFRFKLSFSASDPENPVDATSNSRVGRYRVLAGIYHVPQGVECVPWLGWINDQGGETSPNICDSDFEGVEWGDSISDDLKAFYNGTKIWGGLTEKARWTAIHDKVYKSNPSTALQNFSGQTEALGDGKSLVAGTHLYTRPDIEGFIDFSKYKCCNKKLQYGPNVISAQLATHALNQAAIYNPAAVGDRGLAMTTARDIPFVFIINMTSGEVGGDPYISHRWVHYFQDA